MVDGRITCDSCRASNSPELLACYSCGSKLNPNSNKRPKGIRFSRVGNQSANDARKHDPSPWGENCTRALEDQ